MVVCVLYLVCNSPVGLSWVIKLFMGVCVCFRACVSVKGLSKLEKW